MRRLRLFIFCLAFMQMSTMANALQCPDPNQSSLRYGEIPKPWLENPYSPNTPQGDQNTSFLHVKVLMINKVGRAIVCFYKNSLGEYSIWWPVRSAPDYQSFWFRIDEGYFCNKSLEACQFIVEPNDR